MYKMTKFMHLTALKKIYFEKSLKKSSLWGNMSKVRPIFG
jgi:hypothetical protein